GRCAVGSARVSTHGPIPTFAGDISGRLARIAGILEPGKASCGSRTAKCFGLRGAGSGPSGRGAGSAGATGGCACKATRSTGVGLTGKARQVTPSGIA
ncbi:MAG: hypothetical protein ACP5U2_17170, partial [Bryobacteraceae bacterium]